MIQQLLTIEKAMISGGAFIISADKTYLAIADRSFTKTGLSALGCCFRVKVNMDCRLWVKCTLTTEMREREIVPIRNRTR